MEPTIVSMATKTAAAAEVLQNLGAVATTAAAERAAKERRLDELVRTIRDVVVPEYRQHNKTGLTQALEYGRKFLEIRTLVKELKLKWDGYLKANGISEFTSKYANDLIRVWENRDKERVKNATGIAEAIQLVKVSPSRAKPTKRTTVGSLKKKLAEMKDDDVVRMAGGANITAGQLRKFVAELLSTI